MLKLFQRHKYFISFSCLWTLGWSDVLVTITQWPLQAKSHTFVHPIFALLSLDPNTNFDPILSDVVLSALE